MRVWRRLVRRLEVLFRKARAESELEEELRYHVERETAANVRAGLRPAEARRRALVAFGGVERTKEAVRDVQGGRFLDDLVQDIRYAVRSQRRQPGFLLVALLTLGLGVGANVALFGVVDLAAFRSLPFPGADRLVVARTTSGPNRERNVWTSSWPDFEDYHDGTTSFASLSAVAPLGLGATVSGDDGPERVTTTWIAPAFFYTLGVPLELGREFLPEENEAGGPPVVVISHGLWQRRFGGAPDVVGRSLVVDGVPRTVVGVAPAGFTFLADVDVWGPLGQSGWGMARQSHNWLAIGRRASGVTRAQAQAEVDVVARRLAAAYPETNRDKGLLVSGLQDAIVEGFGPALFGLMAAIALVLLIACANVAGLLLARGSARRREMGVRAALGAGGGRLVRQLLTESALVGLAASALGTLVALALEPALVAATPLRLMGIEASTRWSVLAFAGAVALITVVAFGLPPALAGARVDVLEDMKATGGRTAVGGSRRLRDGLVAAQVALSLVLLLGAGLVFRGLHRMEGVDPGFATERLLTAEIGLPQGRYDQGDQRARFFEALLDRVRAVPGVEAAAVISRIPIRDAGDNVGVFEEGYPPADPSETRLAFQRTVLPGYFAAMGIPILAGRDVRPTDGPEAPPVLVISEQLAGVLFPGGDPLGRRVVVELGGDSMRLEVVGVVGDVRTSSLAGSEDMTMYFSFRQRDYRTMGLVVRASAAPAGLVGPVRASLGSLDPDVPLSEVHTMEEVLSRSLSFTRTVAVALALFAAVALFLAGLGLYGVLAYLVERRRREIGIRVALGAGAADVFRMVLRRGMVPTGIGMGLGLAAALLAGWWLDGLYVPLSAADPSVGMRLSGDVVAVVAVVLFLAAVAVAACLVPARRALGVDPVVAFRTE